MTLTGSATVDVEIGRHGNHDMQLGSANERAVLMTPTGKQKLLRQERETPAALAESTGAQPVSDAVEPGGEEDVWQLISTGDLRAMTIHKGWVYGVGQDVLPVIDCGIFTQELASMTPYTNWTLWGYGSLSSIAVHASDDGDIMYGVKGNGTGSWLYKQALDDMPKHSTWTIASIFKLSAIAIDGHHIYGISPDNPGLLYKTDLRYMVEFSGWQPVDSGNIKTFSVHHGTVYAMFENSAIYTKFLAEPGSFEAGLANRTWMLKDQANLLGVQFVGDHMYGIKPDHKIYRKPCTVNNEWEKSQFGEVANNIGSGFGGRTMSAKVDIEWRSLAIGPYEDVIYALSKDNSVYKQYLTGLGIQKYDWEPISQLMAQGLQSIAIQGHTLYASADDGTVFKQDAKAMTRATSWQLAGKCCVRQLTAGDGIIFGISTTKPYHIWKQVAELMTPTSPWYIANVQQEFTSLATRGDSIYGVSTLGLLMHQKLSTLSRDSGWEITSFEDGKYPSNEYLCLMAHRDLMYACGKDFDIYTKIIKAPVAYAPHLRALGNTRWQALHYNLTDMWNHSLSPIGIHVPNPNATSEETSSSSNSNSTYNGGHVEDMMSTPSTTYTIQEAGVSANYVDHYQDQPSVGNDNQETIDTSNINGDSNSGLGWLLR